MSLYNQSPYAGGGYTLPRHVFIRDPQTADIADGHVAHPSGDSRYGLVNGHPLVVSSMLPMVGIATSGKV